MPVPFISPIQAMQRAQTHDANLEGAQTENALKRFQMQKAAEEMQRMNALQAALAGTVRPDNSIDYQGMAAALVKGGNPQGALAVHPILEGQKLNDFYKTMGEDIDPSMLAGKAAQAGLGSQVPGFLELQRKIAESRSQAADKQRDFGLRAQNELMTPDGKGGYQINRQLLDAKNMIAKSGASSNNIRVNTEKSLFGNMAEQVGKSIALQSESAKAAPAQIRSAQSIMDAIDSGKVITGPGANYKVAGLQIAQSLGFGSGAESLVKTRETIKGMAQLTMAARNQLKGQGQITDFETKLLEKAESGDISQMSVPEIRRLAELADLSARLTIRANNENVGKLAKQPNASPLADYMKVEEPPEMKKSETKKGAPSIQDLYDEAKRRGLVK